MYDTQSDPLSIAHRKEPDVMDEVIYGNINFHGNIAYVG